MNKWMLAQEKVRKRFAGVFSALMICAVLWPVQENWRAKPHDNFPLSYYPMFTAEREGKLKLTYMVGITAQGERLVIPYRYASKGGLNMVRKQIRKRVAQGGAAALAQSVAARLARKKRDHRLAGVVTVQIVTGRYRLAEYFAGNKTPLKEKVHASCAVERVERRRDES
jgi:hypothetical protein